MSCSFQRTLILISVFLLASISINAQKIIIQGTIVDSTLSQPVSFANISIGFNRGTTSDENGNFRLPINLEDIKDTLHISCIGYTESKIPIEKIALYEQNTIYLSPSIYQLNNVTIKGKSKRIPRATAIIKEALLQLDSIYYTDTITYEGYYREYVKQENEYLNLFEGIINLEEFRNDFVSSFETELIYKRINQDFPIDQALTKAYDNDEKFVPFSRVPSKNINELVFLRKTDPLKNVTEQTISYIDKIKEDLIQHHRFSRPQLTYLNERPFYVISFVDNQNFKQGTNKVEFEGKIFVDAENHGIKKISYLAKIDKGFAKQKLYELNVEYRLFEDKYILNYVSFNNLFMIMDFLFKDAKSGNGKLMLEFSRNVSKINTTPENFNIHYKNVKQEIEQVEIVGNKVLVSIKKDFALAEDLKRLNRLFEVNDQERNLELEHQVLSQLNIEFNGIFDEFQNPLSNKKYSEYYQYREIFVHKILDKKITPGQFNVSIPVFKNKMIAANNMDIDTTWLNTPLINEDTKSRLNLSEHRLFNTYINQKTVVDIKTKNEIAYLHLDREVYAPEDTIWFKGYIRNKKELIPSDLSKTFFVKLINSSGEIKWADKFLIENATVKGQIPVDVKLEEGIYYINGYSSWIENFEPQQTFTKKILIQKEKRDKVQMMVAYDKEEYFPGDTMQLQLTCMDGYNKKLDDVRFRFRVMDGKNDIFKGNGKTGSKEESLFQVILPNKIDSLPRIEIISNHEGLIYTKTYQMPVDYFLAVNFFPEGGYLLNGLKSNVAFKVETRFGLPVDIEGEIVNDKGEIVEQAKTEHDGMGLFALKPRPNESYYLKLKKPGVFNEKYYLPTAKDTGMQLSVSEKNSRIVAQIENQNMENDTVLLTVMVRGKLVYYKAFDSRKTSAVRIPSEQIPQGVAVFTLFDNDLLPRAERLLFVNGNHEMHTKITTDRESYQPRDSVVLKIQVTEDADFADEGSYSLSVVDDQLCSSEQIDEPGIVSYLLMSPEIKGKINNPNYYFENNNEAVSEHLDLLMLTQGWRKYKIIKNEILDGQIEVPVNMETISGFLMKQPFGKEQQPSAGSISVLFGGLSTRIPVEKNGKFSFVPDYNKQQNTGVSMYAKDEKGKSEVSIVLDENLFKKELSDYLSQLTDSLSKNTVPLTLTYNRFDEHFSYSLENHYWIDEVVVSKKIIEDPITTADLATTKRSLAEEDIEMFTSIEDLVEYYASYFNYSENIYYVIDDNLQATTRVDYTDDGEAVFTRVPDYSYAQGIKPEDIEEITLVKGYDVTLYGLSDLGSEEYTRSDENRVKAVVVDIKLKPFSERENNRLWNSNQSLPKFAVAKEFYSPVYDTGQKRNSQLPDLRKTILWDNDVKFNKEGVATIKFYNGDRYTRIKCILEGINDSGTPVRSEFMYKVDL